MYEAKKMSKEEMAQKLAERLVKNPKLLEDLLDRLENDEIVSEMKRLVFGNGPMVPVLDGGKRFTVRKYREGAHDFTKGEIILGEFKDGLNILLKITQDTKKDLFENLMSAKKYVDKRGYYFDDKYFYELTKWYPDLKLEDMGAVIFFEVLKVNGVPVVSSNEH